MATIKGGVKICDGCGCDCTRLYGFVMEIRKNMMSDGRVKEKVDEIVKKFGQSDFIFCWDCTASAFGAMTIKQKAMAKARESKGTNNGDKKDSSES